MPTSAPKVDYTAQSDVPGAQATLISRTRAIGDGFEAGALGAAVVAAWFLLIDVLAGHPFYTPSLLGTAMTRGVDEALRTPGVSVGMVYAYTGIHFVLFILFGIAMATMVIQYQRTPVIGYLFVVLAVVFELGFLVFILAFAEPLLRGIPWWGVLVGNALALTAMVLYFRARHPALCNIKLPVN